MFRIQKSSILEYMCIFSQFSYSEIETYYKRIWPENWVDGGGLGITIRNEPWETVLTSIPLSGRGVGNAAGHVKISPKF